LKTAIRAAACVERSASMLMPPLSRTSTDLSQLACLA
jgi:hypothetical protein